MAPPLRRLLAAAGAAATAVAVAVIPSAYSTAAPTAVWAEDPIIAAPTIYEAEDARISQGVVESNHAGFSGRGFVNYNDVAGSYVEWTVSAAQAGTVMLAIRYANGMTANRPMDITVNEELAANDLAFNGTGAWTTWQARGTSVPLNAGANKIRATAVAAAGGPNIDRLIVDGGESEPPATPRNLRTTEVKPTSVGLAWDPATDNVGITSYEVYNQGQFVKSVPGNVLSTTITGLKPNTPFGFYVNAKDAAGNISQASNTVEGKTPPDQVDPIPPSAPKNLRSTNATANSVSLAWDAATDNVGVVKYEIYSNGNNVGDSTTTSGTVDGLKANTTYPFTVKAFDTAGNASPDSNRIEAKTRAGGDQIGEVKQITTSSDIPWGLGFLPDGSALVAERDTFNIVRVTPAGQKTTVGKVPGVSGTNGEGGLLGLEISPNYNSDKWIYLYHTASGDNRVVRMKYDNGALSSHQVLLTGIPRNKFHNGGRLRFGPDGKLYAATGDAQNGANAQNLNSLGGKVLRLNTDGSAPSDNPFFGNGGNARYVWSYGHRNVQGLAFDSQGRLWEAELGNSQMDELNLIQKGGHYGWPSCEGTSGKCSGFIAPKRTWSVSSASPSGIAIVNNVIYMAALRGTRLYRLVINGSSIGSQTVHFQGTYGRLRTVEPSPAGGLWLTTSNGDKDSTPNNSNTRILHVALG